MDEDVIDDGTEVIASGFGALGRTVRFASGKLGGGRLAHRGSAAALAGVGIDDPRRSERVRTGLVLVMVAILGLIVLSSVVLG
jgi:hypothetical protein